MSDSCPSCFNETLISGYLDGELTQAESQRVRLHLEECEPCRHLYEEMKSMQEVAMNTPFPEPAETEWPERPRTPGSAVARPLGWVIFIAWLIAVAGFAAWQWIATPETLVERVLVVGGITGIFLLFLSVLLDRIKGYKSDKYRGVKR